MDNCVRKVGKDYSAITGLGAFVWGDYNEISSKSESLLLLFWGLFTGILVSPASELKLKDSELREHLVITRQAKIPDGLTKWAAHRFIPFHHKLQHIYPYQDRKYLYPF